jgi:hypothetical protein
MTVANLRDRSIDVVIEPWGDLRALAPQQTLVVSYEDRGELFASVDGALVGSNLKLELQDDHVKIWAEGREGILDWVPPPSSTPPPVPPQMGRTLAQADPLTALQQWYLAQCDGDWEHEYGVELTTLDNPGWALDVNLADSAFNVQDKERELVERSEHDWVAWGVEREKFAGACGPLNLSELIGIFLAFVESPDRRTG